MFDNIGGKIKGLAKIIFWIIVICFSIFGLSMLTQSSSSPVYFLGGLLSIGLGIVMAWLSTCLLYGYGELIEKTSQIERNTRGGFNIVSQKGNVVSDVQADAEQKRIDQLNNLRSIGLITEDEYQQALANKD